MPDPNPRAGLLLRVTRALEADFEVLRLLGEGGMASVFLARERALKRLVAIKVLAPELATGSDARGRFQREAETAAGLQHPNIVPIYRVGEADGLAYFTMGYVEGESVAARLQAEGRLPAGQAARVAREVASALGAAHRQGVIHRDIKPQNILLERQTGRVLVTDFGIAQVTAPDVAGDTEALTIAGMVMGTPRYMSPEQATGDRDLTPASDLYALGVVLYELLTGDFPYQVGPQRNFLMAHLTQDPVPLVARVGDIPPELEQVVLRLLAKEPGQRLQSAEDVATALDTGEVSTGTMAVPARRRAGRRAVVPAFLAFLLVVAGVRFFRGAPGPPAGVNPRQSILLGFFTNTRASADLDWLRIGGVELLAQSLSRWQDLHVVGIDRLLDLARREDLSDGAPLSRSQSLALARAAGVWTTTTGTIVPAGRDSIRFTVRVYDVASGNELQSAAVDVAVDGDLQRAFDVLADQLLQVAGAPQAAFIEIEPPTRSIEAFRHYIEGIAARNAWKIDTAAAAFRRAIDHDSTFGLAYLELSQVQSTFAGASPDPEYVRLADSAVFYAREASPTVRLLIRAYRALVYADFAEARRLSRELIARDSTLTDGWTGLGAAAYFDWTYVGAGQDRRFPMDPTLTLRSYRTALSLDREDYRVYPILAAMFMAAASDDPAQRIPAYEDGPPGPIHTLYNRLPTDSYTLVMVTDDSLVPVNADSLAERFPTSVLREARTRARAHAEALMKDWLALAPDQGIAWLYLASIQHLDGQYREGLASLARAEAVGLPSATPYPVLRLGRLLEAQFFDEALTLADSLDRIPREARSVPLHLLSRIGLANTALVKGHIDRALTLRQEFLDEAIQFQLSEELRNIVSAAPEVARLRLRAYAGTVTPAELAQAQDAMAQAAATMSDSSARQFLSSRNVSILIAAAELGDTAAMAAIGPDDTEATRSGFDAWGAVQAGDMEGARRRYQAAVADTAAAPGHVAALARTAEALGLHAEALRHYRRLDTLRYRGLALDSDYLVLVRSYAFRAAVFQATGQADSAATYYRRFLTLWDDPDPSLRGDRDLARRALAELERADQGDR